MVNVYILRMQERILQYNEIFDLSKNNTAILAENAVRDISLYVQMDYSGLLV